MKIDLPMAKGVRTYEMSGCIVPTVYGPRRWPRRVFSAAHVVADPRSNFSYGRAIGVDWDATLRYRRHLCGLGFGIAEAMDTAQRGMGLTWPLALELTRRCVDAVADIPNARVYAGAGTDHLSEGASATIDAVISAYTEQIDAIQLAGARVVLMTSRALARAARTPEDYLHVYGSIVSRLDRPAILHWLGPMFDPALEGYWGVDRPSAAADVCLELLSRHAGKFEGVKLSMLDAALEVSMRRRLPTGVSMFTGDDFNFPELIAGDDLGYSDALLGVFDPLAPLAAAAFDRLATSDLAGFRARIGPAIPFARKVFEAPTQFYKSGVTFVAWLNGWQDHFVMLEAQQTSRSIIHYAELFELADRLGLFVDPERACHRARSMFSKLAM
jgi:hypothetical protein